MKYKVGDKVRIKSLDWYYSNLSIPSKIVWRNKLLDDIVGIWCGAHIFTKQMCDFCDSVMTIRDICEDYYIMEGEILGYKFTDEMIEHLVAARGEGYRSYAFGPTSQTTPSSELWKKAIKEGVSEPTTEEFIETLTEDVFNDKSDNPEISSLARYGEDIYAYKIPEGYEFHAVYDGEIQLKKKETKYPTTYEECYEVMYGKKSPFHTPQVVKNIGYKGDLFTKLQRLIFYRDAYWKIAGEKMGLGKPWEPDFTNFEEDRYRLYTCANKIVLDSYGGGDVNVILTFPTEEMRDAFYENFKKEIEMCKELL